MTTSKCLLRRSAGPFIALIGLAMGFITTVHGQDRAIASPVTKALVIAPTWLPTGNLNAPRRGHTATLLSNGTVLVVGGAGYSNDALDSAELYDVATGRWAFSWRPNCARH